MNTKDGVRASNGIRDGALIILAAVALTVSLIYTKSILVPFVFAVFIQIMLKSGIFLTQKYLRVPEKFATTVAIVIFLLMTALTIFFMGASFEKFFASAGEYKEKIVVFTKKTHEYISAYGPEMDHKSFISMVKKIPLFKMANNVGEVIVNLFADISLVFIFVLFLMMGNPSGKMEHPLLETIELKISRYIGGKFVTSFLTGLIVGLTLVIFRIDLAFMFAVATFLLNFIPNLGSLVAVALPLPVILLQYGLGWQFTVILCVSLAAQFIIGNILEPKMMGESMDLHPIVVLIFLMFWGSVWGVSGMFLSVPITAILKIILEQIPTTRPIALLLAGRIERS